MKIEFVERNYDIGKRLRELTLKKITKLDRYFNDDATAKVVCSQDGKKFKLELTIHYKKNIYRSECYGENMFDNLDVVLPKIEKQIIKFSERNKEKFKQNAFALEKFEFINEKPESKKKNILRIKTFDLDPTLLDDAKQNLENLGHDFYVFLNAETGRVNVLYNRKDGELGLIDCKV